MTRPIATTAKHEHTLPSTLLTRRVRVLLIGCGGTGSAMGTGLVYLHQALLVYGHPEGIHVTVVDGDRISRANCVRQPFSETEVGLYKADVLVSRINLFWGLDWNADIRFVDKGWTDTDRYHILISCVDSRTARKSIMDTRAYTNSDYWLDLGNSSDSGQFVLGEPTKPTTKDARRLPTVAELFPEIVDPKLDAKDRLPSCSALEALESQSPFINQTLAYQALGMLARFFRRGKLTYHGGFVNLNTGRVSPLPIDPGTWKRLSQTVRTPSAKTTGSRSKRRAN
jgi:PRTRC genetic system ThiF family protein